MNKLRIFWTLIFLLSCSKESVWKAPDFHDDIQTVPSKAETLVHQIPAYGISVPFENSIEFEVNLEAHDSPFVRVGREAEVFILPQSKPIPCKVRRVLLNASTETGQGLAWLRPQHPESIPTNEFVYALITTQTKRRGITIPREAVYIRDGKTWVIQSNKTEKDKSEFVPTEVTLGEAFHTNIEVLSGIHLGDKVVVRGGLGILYPEFKEEDEED